MVSNILIRVYIVKRLSSPAYLNIRPPWEAKNGANTRDSTAMSLIRMLRDGPDASLSGSPITVTVQPLWTQ